MPRRTLFGWLVVPLGIVACDSSEDEVTQVENPAVVLLSLPNSDFEIDSDANLKVDFPSPSLDWGNVTEARQPDLPSGQADNSFGQGTKEDTASPTIVNGGIPPNKSDLLTFGAYLEQNADGKFLHVYWHRVQEPSGTTNMDFEFNQSSDTTSNEVTPVRTSGDVLIQYDLSQGGTRPVISVSYWIDGSEGMTKVDCEASNSLPCWAKRTTLTTEATGSINTSAIPASESDGLGDISPRTFGEASIDFNALVGGVEKCKSFGSAYLKSRSSDSFTAALKDFIAPVGVNISNCGRIKLIKKDDADNDLNGASFSLIRDVTPIGAAPGAEDVTTVATCMTSTMDIDEVSETGRCLFTNVYMGDYWLVETAAPTGYDMATPAYQHVTVTADSTVTVTFVDPRQRGAILVTKTRKHAADGAGDHAQSGVTFTVNGVSKQTDANGQACWDNLLFAEYTVTETVPTGYKGMDPKKVTVDNAATCSATPYVGESVTFRNTPLSDISVSFSSQVTGGTAAKISCSGLTSTPADATPSSFDDTSESYVSLEPGTYTCTIVIDP